MSRRLRTQESCPHRTAGDLVQWHPHLHLLTSDGGKTADGSWQPLREWDGVLLMTLFRERLLARLLETRAISQELVAKLASWRHPGLSAHVGEPIAPEEKQRLEETAAYLVRNPLSLKKLVYVDGKKAVLYRSRMNPFLGRHFGAMDPLEWLARLSDHIPDPGQHRTLFCAEYSSRVRGSGESHEPEMERPREAHERRRVRDRYRGDSAHHRAGTAPEPSESRVPSPSSGTLRRRLPFLLTTSINVRTTVFAGLQR